MIKLICQRCVRFRQRGEKGDPGHNGRFFYYAGPYNQNASYVMTETQAPYVSSVVNGVKKFFMLDLQGSEPSSLPFTATLPPTANGQSQWTEMQSQHKYYIVEAIFADSAYLGSLVIKGNWMLSQYGTVSGSASQDYTAFDSNHPNDDTGSNFIPNFCVNMLTGKGYFNDVELRGYFEAAGGDLVIKGIDETLENGIKRSGSCILLGPHDDDAYIRLEDITTKTPNGHGGYRLSAVSRLILTDRRGVSYRTIINGTYVASSGFRIYNGSYDIDDERGYDVGFTGTFTAANGKTVTVTGGIITDVS